MCKALSILIATAALFTGFLLLAWNNPIPDSGTKNHTYTSEKYGISFSYPDDYVLSEQTMPGGGEREHHSITIIHKNNLPVPTDGEGPPAITIDIYQNNLDKLSTESWIRNTPASNFKLSSEQRLSSLTIAGKPALSYRWSGLYEGTTIVLADDMWIYALSVTYLSPGDDIIQDFVSLRESIRMSQQKADTQTPSDDTPQNVTLSGTFECLPHKDAHAPQMEECVFGLKADDGTHYVVNFGASARAMELFQSKARITAEGILVPKEALGTDQWEKYNMRGIFTVTNILPE